VLPLNSRYFVNKTTYVATVADARTMLEFARQSPLSCVGLDTEFKYDRPGVELKKNLMVFDPRSIHPLLLSLAFVEPNSDGGSISCFVVDLRKPELLSLLREIFRLPVRFVGHFVKVEHFCVWQMGLPEPAMIWDTWVAEKARYLGKWHYRYKLPAHADEIDDAHAKEDAEDDDAFFCSLLATCHRHGVTHRGAAHKRRLQQSFLVHPDGAPFTEEQIAYAAEDAIVAALLFPKQVGVAVNDGTLHHLETIEMPWVRTTARVEWNGIKIDGDKVKKVASVCLAHLSILEAKLLVYGISNFRSHNKLCRFFTAVGMLPLFRKDGKSTFERKQLELHLDCHEAVPTLYVARLIYDMQKSGIFDFRLIGADGRMHPVQQQLGTHTGRQTTRAPNVLGIARILRPLIVAADGYGIGEVDLSQIEVGIAAAIYGDEALIKMYNTGDVYSAMAQHFYAAELTEAERNMSGGEFKDAREDLRDRMKICTLGIIYGMTPFGISRLLHITESEARTLLNQFMAMFPTLKKALGDMAMFGAIAGHVATVTGLRRYRARPGQLSNWERNWMTNHPVQGSAADTFKDAGNRLDRIYQAYDTRLLIPFHDAIVFEAPLDKLEEVANLTKQELCRAVQQRFPQLKPRADINITRPDCWNKKGMADTWERWVTDPLSFMPGSVKEIEK